MNPPAALLSAMGKERKPFTYTPGGLDLSEIKSERMARRLMKNAMSPGVQEVTSPSPQSPTGPPSTFPQAHNYYNLPVQVFPAFQLPANPKALLRTRSQPRENSMERTPQSVSYAGQPNVDDIMKESLIMNSPRLPRRQSREMSPLASHGMNFTPHISPLAANENSSKITAVPPLTAREFSPKLSQGFSPRPAQVSPFVASDISPRVSSPFSPLPPGSVLKPQPNWNNGTEERNLDRVSPVIVVEPFLRMPSEILQKNITEDKKVKPKKKTPPKEINDEDNKENTEVEATVRIKPKKTISTSVEILRKILPDGKVEETKITTINTIINDKIEDSKVQTETRILSDEEAKAVIEEEEEEEEEEVEEEEPTIQKTVVQKTAQKGEKESSKTETKKTVTTKQTKVTSETRSQETKTVAKETTPSEDEEEEEVVVTVHEDEVVEQKTHKPESKQVETVKKAPTPEPESEEEEEEEEEEEVKEEVVKKTETVKDEIKQTEPVKNVEQSESEEEEEDEEEDEEQVVVEKTVEKIGEKVEEPRALQVNGTTHESEEEEEEEEEVEETTDIKKNEPSSEAPTEKTEETETPKECLPSQKHATEPEQPKSEPQPPTSNVLPSDKDNVRIKTELSETKTETITSNDVPEVHTTSKKESTEITSSVLDNIYGVPVTTQTELHRVEKTETVNRSYKTLDNSYEQMTQHGVPTVKTYFAPNRERISTSPQPAKPYTPTYVSDKIPERRHSLLLDRLSIERQVAPPESYQNTSSHYLSNETTNLWSQEPQSEVVNVSNVKPSSISNSQWYQQQQQQQQQHQQQQQQHQQQQQQYQEQQQQHYQPQQQSENIIYNNVKPATHAQQWQTPLYTEPARPTSACAPDVPGYGVKPSTWGSNNLGNLDRLPSINEQSNQYSFMSNKSATESYKHSSGTQQYESGYVPPPWEIENQPTPAGYYRAPTAGSMSQSTAPPWNLPTQESNFSKPTKPVSYQPPAPNQSFVKHTQTGLSQEPGRKTYYSEYERRYISVPESTYIPAETKLQPQCDPSPQYYYDNNEPQEQIEPPWRKELREFSEKSTNYEETSAAQPPWDESQYPKDPSATYTPQPTWSQTLRPRSWKERSFESESLQYQNTQEWPKSNTLNKRPVSAFVKTRLDSPSLERSRGVSVDRYNANSYQPPAPYTPSANNGYALPWEIQEQPQLMSPTQQSVNAQQTMVNPQIQTYHNPQVPAYHARAPTEPREYQPNCSQRNPGWSGQSRACPVQSRSFKYLQMLTGTEDGLQQPEPFVVQQPHHAATRPRRI